jgi:hypothetical protein
VAHKGHPREVSRAGRKPGQPESSGEGKGSCGCHGVSRSSKEHSLDSGTPAAVTCIPHQPQTEGTTPIVQAWSGLPGSSTHPWGTAGLPGNSDIDSTRSFETTKGGAPRKQQIWGDLGGPRHGSSPCHEGSRLDLCTLSHAQTLSKPELERAVL